MARRGALLLFFSAVLFGVIGGLVKRLSLVLPTESLVFFRNAVGLMALLPLTGILGKEGLGTREFGSHAYRALSGLGGMYLSFFALGRMPLADAMALGYTAPLFMPFIARVRLGEAMPRHVAPALALGFLGVLLILKPGFGVFRPVALAALGSGFLAAVAQVGIRHLTRTEPSFRIVFYFGLVSTVVSGIPAAFRWKTPPASLWPALLLVGSLATAAQLFLTAGYRRTSPARGGPMMYVAVATAGAMDWAVWRRLPDAWSVAGVAAIVGAGAYILRRSGAAVIDGGGA
ncbi:MAG: DMT family transporter [Elusimicrobia bacterium]|nr:DMT family transporter [Elusimicrobiota bacterium]